MGGISSETVAGPVRDSLHHLVSVAADEFAGAVTEKLDAISKELEENGVDVKTRALLTACLPLPADTAQRVQASLYDVKYGGDRRLAAAQLMDAEALRAMGYTVVEPTLPDIGALTIVGNIPTEQRTF